MLKKAEISWESLDVARAIGIAAVVVGHACGGSALWSAITLFHMPFFFILSGGLCRGNQPPWEYFKRKALHLLVPYFTYLILFNFKTIGGFFGSYIKGGMNGEKILFYEGYFLGQLVGGEFLKGNQAVFWFPACLFITQQIANAIFSLRSRWMIGITGLFYIIGFINQYLFQDFYLPFAINVVAGALPFFVAGRFIARDVRMWLPRILIFIFAIACLSGDWARFLGYEMKYAVYGFPILSAFVAVGGYFSVFAIAELIQSRFFFHKPLAFVGRASMTIMYLHMPILIFLKSIGWTDTVSISLFAIAATTAVHWILSGNTYTEKFFLGNFTRSAR